MATTEQEIRDLLKSIDSKLDRIAPPDNGDTELREPAQKEKTYTCDKCGREFVNRHKYAGHVGRCKG